MHADTMEDQFEKFINLGDDRNIIEVYVQGVCVKRGDVFTGGCITCSVGWGKMMAETCALTPTLMGLTGNHVWFADMQACAFTRA